MQSNKASKKTSKTAEENSPTSAVTEPKSSTRTSKSSKSKDTTTESRSARHHKSSSPVATAPSPIENEPATKALAASAGAGASIDSAVVVSERVPAALTHEEIATLAHYYWIARGGGEGSAEQDWLRAERELRAKRLAR